MAGLIIVLLVIGIIFLIAGIRFLALIVSTLKMHRMAMHALHQHLSWAKLREENRLAQEGRK